MAHFSKIEILGIRGFSIKQELLLAEPNGTIWSGLTLLVWPNNSGKSTIYEAFRAISQNDSPSFTEGKRNKLAGDKIEIKISRTNWDYLTLKTIDSGGSETIFEENKIFKRDVKFFTLPSRRTFSTFFNKNIVDRERYINISHLPATRGGQLEQFAYRLFQIQQNQTSFNLVLKKILWDTPAWHIEQADNGQYYLKFNYWWNFHNSDGAGEWLLSIFTIVDALYDSHPGDVIFIDEPELSLHPSLQKKLIDLFIEYSKDRQIIISTHSPYFISWLALSNGGTVARIVREKDGTKVYQLQKSTVSSITPLTKNLNNPHILGLDAREVFFLDDNIVLVEGQEDVIFINKILELKWTKINGTFYGWGMWGADNTDKIVQMLTDLWFKKIAVIFDKNKNHLIPTLEPQFPNYSFMNIPTDDIRDKSEVSARPGITGLINSAWTIINPSHNTEVDTVLNNLNSYFNS